MLHELGRDTQQASLQSWMILACGFAVLFVAGGSRFALSLMLKPMTADLGWSRTLVSLIGTLFMAVSALGQPLVGRLSDRHHPLWIIGFGLFLSSIGLALMSLVASVWQALLAYGLIFALGQAATSIIPVGVMVIRSYGTRRGFATSVAISGSATGQLVIMGAVAAVLSSVGWRHAYGLLGVVNLLVVVGLVAIVLGLRRRFPPPAPRPHFVPQAIQVSRPRLLSRRQIRLLLVVYMICGLQDFFVSTHVVAFATDHGVPAVVAGHMLALMGLMGLLGVLAAGALADAYGPVLPTALCFLTRIGLFGYIPFMRHDTSIMVFALLYGATFLVTAPLTVVFAEQAVGRAHMGWVSGILTMVHHIAGGVGALLGGSVFDQWGSYNQAFVMMFVLSLVALWASWALKSRTEPAWQPSTAPLQQDSDA